MPALTTHASRETAPREGKLRPAYTGRSAWPSSHGLWEILTVETKSHQGPQCGRALCLSLGENGWGLMARLTDPLAPGLGKGEAGVSG